MSGALSSRQPLLNAFCVDLEEWFHICAADTPYADPRTWNDAPVHVVRDTERLASMLEEHGVRGTFLTVGWIAERHPQLIERLARTGHEIGCHGYYHRLLFEQTPEEFEDEITRSVELLRRLTGQPVTVFRAPGFSMTSATLWAYPILRRHGITTDVSIVPAARNHGGIVGFSRDPLRLRTDAGDLTIFPVSVMRFAGRTFPFSGGGYLRLFPLPLIRYGFRQNHQSGRPCMSYIHPREINVAQPRLRLSPRRRFMHYVGIHGAEAKLRQLLREYAFGTVTAVCRQMSDLPSWSLRGNQLQSD